MSVLLFCICSQKIRKTRFVFFVFFWEQMQKSTGTIVVTGTIAIAVTGTIVAAVTYG